MPLERVTKRLQCHTVDDKMYPSLRHLLLLLIIIGSQNVGLF